MHVRLLQLSEEGHTNPILPPDQVVGSIASFGLPNDSDP